MPPDGHRSEGTPSLSEGPYVRGETFGYFGAFAKVTRCKSETASRNPRRNGYTRKTNKSLVGPKAAKFKQPDARYCDT